MSGFNAAAGARSARNGTRRSPRGDPDGRAGVVELANGRVLASRRWSGTGVPLVALHGLFDCSLGWKHVAAAARRPCVAFDLPGFGRSGMPAENRFASYARDIVCALDMLGSGELLADWPFVPAVRPVADPL
jgi:pimeloyl-ACP methyl ester carboxylesterase